MSIGFLNFFEKIFAVTFPAKYIAEYIIVIDNTAKYIKDTQIDYNNSKYFSNSIEFIQI